MKLKLLYVAVSIVFAGCIDATSTKDIEIEFLQEVDGCKIYRVNAYRTPPQLLWKCDKIK